MLFSVNAMAENFFSFTPRSNLVVEFLVFSTQSKSFCWILDVLKQVCLFIYVDDYKYGLLFVCLSLLQTSCCVGPAQFYNTLQFLCMFLFKVCL